MAQRTYGQHCGLARALDLVGERWTLLLVRELLLGPQRFGVLLSRLRGIGPNLLSTRLKRLIAEGLVERDAEGTYLLTSRGKELEEALVALTRFGLQGLGQRDPRELWSAAWTPLALRASFQPERAAHLDEEYEFRVDGEVFHVSIQRGELATGPGPARFPALVVEIDGETFLRLAGGELSSEEALEHPGARVDGGLAALRRCLEVFGRRPSAPREDRDP